MQQFCEVNAKAVVGIVKPLNNCLQLVCYVNKLDNHGNFTKREILYVSLFNAALKAILKRNVKPGDIILLRNGEYNTFINPQNVTYTSVACNYTSQVDIIAVGNHDILNQRTPEELVS